MSLRWAGTGHHWPPPRRIPWTPARCHTMTAHHPAGLGDLGFGFGRAFRRITAPVRRIAAPVTRPLQRLTAPVVDPASRLVSRVNDQTVRRVVESDAVRSAAIKTAVTGAQAGLIVGGSFLGPAGTAGGALLAQALSTGLGPKYGAGWAVRGISIGQVAGGVATGGLTALIPTALQAGTALLASRGESAVDVPADTGPAAFDPQQSPADGARFAMPEPGTVPANMPIAVAPAASFTDASWAPASAAPGTEASATPATDFTAPTAFSGRSAMMARSLGPAAMHATPTNSSPASSLTMPLLIGGAAIATVLLLRSRSLPATNPRR